MKFWVIGKDGLVGREMCNFFKSKEVEFIGSARGDADICKPGQLEAFYTKHQPTHIINCAAYVNVDKAEAIGAGNAFEINVEGSIYLARLAKKHDLGLIGIGTDYVFNGRIDRDYSEDDETDPINIYGKTKEEGERQMFEIYPKACSVRTASLYGTAKEGLVHYTLKGLKLSPDIVAISDQVSTPTNVAYLVQALYDMRDQSGIYHFVNRGSTSRLGLTKEIQRLAVEKGVEMKCRSIYPETIEGSKRIALRPRRTVLSIHKIEPFLSFINPSWQEALRECLEEIVENE